MYKKQQKIANLRTLVEQVLGDLSDLQSLLMRWQLISKCFKTLLTFSMKMMC